MEKEYIICSAIWYKDSIKYINAKKTKVAVSIPNNIDKGFVVCGRRHHNIIALVAFLSGEGTHENTVQGFLTNTDRFLDRNEAAKLAYEAGQIKEMKNQLFSEDLY